MAATKGCLEAVRALLEHGAEVDQADNDGDTPLSMACAAGHEEVRRVRQLQSSRMCTVKLP